MTGVTEFKNFMARSGTAWPKSGLIVCGAAVIACSGQSAMQVDETAVAEPPQPVAAPVDVAIVPAPRSLSESGQPFVLRPDTRIRFTGGKAETALVAGYLAQLIQVTEGSPRPVQESQSAGIEARAINLVIDPTRGALGAEGYHLRITPEAISATATDPAGLFYAVQTLRQLLPPSAERGQQSGHQAVRGVDIVDSPRFEWRGAMLDVARHFLPPTDVKRYIDMMALYKLNRLHLHLSDDQGWRIEIRSWPNLTARGGSTAVGGGAGGFYTQTEYANLVQYARERFITVVPEIDMPGHTNAALASYAELNCDNRARPLYTGINVGFSSLCVTSEATYRFVNDVVREISALTPGAWFHIGGDEVEKLSAAEYARFVERAQSIVRSHGKHTMGWGEIAAARLDPTTVVQHWRPASAAARGAIRQRAKVVMSPANKVYLDMKYTPSTALGLKWAGYVTTRTAYDWDPARLVEGLSESSILGVEAPLWSETLVTLDDFEFMAFPRLAAVAEVGWSPQSRRSWDGFRTRAAAHGARWNAMGINFHRTDEIPWQ